MSQAIQQPQARRPRLGFLGVGWIGRHRLDAIARAGVANIIGVADPQFDAARQAAAAVPDAAVFRSLEEMLAAELDGVVIATPSALHTEQCIAALERGLAVFCQKPLGRTAAETARIVEAARRADRLLGVDLSYRYTMAMRRIRELIRSGALGDLYALNLVFHNAYGPDKAWFYDAKLSGGGSVIDLGIHLVDLALWCMDFPTVADAASQLFAQGKPISRRGECVEDYAAAQLRFDNGAVAQLACSWKLNAGCDCVIEASFYGTRGGATFRNVNGSFYDFVAERFDSTRRETLSSPPDEWGGRAAVDWAEALAAGGRFDLEAERFVETAAALDHIYEGR
ncbi:MAG: Gfo/Idh/MocA family protein [Blastocatellia bacterium]